MRFRKLRIAWSVGWGLVAVLLCGLWIQSYGTARVNNISAYDSSNICHLQLGSHHGDFAILVNSNLTDLLGISQWRAKSNEVDNNDSAKEFVYRRTISHLLIVLPFRLPTLLSLLMAAIPWIPWSRRYTLRSLVITTTLVAVALGIIVWM